MREKRGNLLQALAMAALIGMAGCQSPVPTTQTAESTQVNSEARTKAEAKRAEFAGRYNLLSNSCFELQGQGDGYNGQGFVFEPMPGEQTVCQVGYDSDGYPVKVIEVRNCEGKTVDWYEFYSGNETGFQWWHISGVWLWYGCPPKTTPTPTSTPTPTPTPSGLTLKLEYPAFSPNADGVKDGNLVTVEAQDSWTIEVDGHPGTIDTGPGPNSDNKSFPWDGAVNDIILPDGKYTLRLTANGEVRTTDVVVDTTPPDVTAVKIAPNSNGLGASITASILDPNINGATSGVDEGTIVINSNGHALSGIESSYTKESAALRADISPEKALALSIPAMNENSVAISVSDIAGNAVNRNSILVSGFETQLAYDIEQEHPGVHSAYSVLGLGKNKDVMRPLLKDTLEVSFWTSAKTPTFYAAHIFSPFETLPVKSHIFTVPSSKTQYFTWDGRRSFEPYPSGKYVVRTFLMGLWAQYADSFSIDNSHRFDWYTDPKYKGNRVKIIWGRPTSTHHWDLFVPAPLGLTMGTKVPTKVGVDNELTIWGYMLPAMQYAVGSGDTIKFGNIVREKPARQGLDVFYRASYVDVKGISRLVEIHMNRRLDGAFVKETVTSAYVVL